MKDITLYGHLTIDTILDGKTEKKALGSNGPKEKKEGEGARYNCHQPYD